MSTPYMLGVNDGRARVLTQSGLSHIIFLSQVKESTSVVECMVQYPELVYTYTLSLWRVPERDAM